MVFIQELKPGKYYLVKKVKTQDGWRKKILRRATREEYLIYQQAKIDGVEITLMSCHNPECDNQFWLTRQQKRKLFTTYVLRYKRGNFPYCSTKCQEEHSRRLRIEEDANRA